MKRLTRPLLSALRVVLGTYAGLCLILFGCQSSMVYYPNRNISSTPEQLGLSYESIAFATADGKELHGWFIPAANAKAVVIFCHGNAGNISHRLDSIGIFHDLGLSTFIFDYRGYGNSRGRPSEKGTYRDVEAAWRYLTETRQVRPDTIVVFGRSLGAAVAAWMARTQTPKALILESAFFSFCDVAAHHYPYVPVRLLARFDYDTAGHVRRVKCPVLIVHSPNDEIIPFSHGKRLFEVAKEPKQFLEIIGGHNEGFIISGRRYRNGLARFLATLDPP